MGLAKYNAKRDFSKTPEPKGVAKKTKTGKLLFVIQKHAASRLHYDFRLEHDGVLWSWAVPKGPSFDTHDKRLAVHVEDHPIRYGDFEGIIPRGEYGGGSVMLWDRGWWEPLGDAATMYREGKLKFVVHGEKLQGAWTLVRMGGRAGEDGKNWLLIKERDDKVRSHDEFDVVEELPNSVVSGRTMSEIAADRDSIWRSGKKVASESDDEAPARGAKAPKKSRPTAKAAPPEIDAGALTGARKRPMPAFVEPQLASLSEVVPSGQQWIYELKLDGYRILAFTGEGKTRLLTRKANDWTRQFATIARTVESISVPAVLDGEACVVRADGTTDFQSLQNALRDDKQDKLTYYVFDMPWCNGYDITAAPLSERKALLREVLASSPLFGSALIFGDHIEGRGDEVFRHACEMGMEGIIAKDKSTPYVGKRMASWLKIKCHLRQEFVIGGYSEPSGTRVGFGALLLGYYEGGKLMHAGRVGTGFDTTMLESLYRKMKKVERKTPAFANPPRGPEARGVHWLEPVLVAEVRFADWTDDGVIRMAAFQGLREDKVATDVQRERAVVKAGGRRTKAEVVSSKASSKASKAPVKATTAKTSARKDEAPETIAGVRVTHPSRVVFPEIGLTKRELVEYYAAVAERILPFVSRRPLSLVRCPDGQGHPCFFQKHLADHTSPVLHGVEVKDKENKGEYLLIRDSEGLLMTVQLGALELHPWAAREDKLEHPEYMVYDFDPGEGVVWERVLEGALVLRARFEELGLRSFVRTSGGKGLHVVVPLARKNDWDEVKAFSKLIAEEMERREPRKYLSVMTKRERHGRIFVDYLRNGRGATAVASYSTRARPSCPIAMPLDWRELDKVERGDQFTIANVAERLRKKDPWDGFFSVKQSITKAMIKEVTAS